MFVVFAVVRLWRAAGGDLRSGVLWYVLALPACWALGGLVARYFSQPCERWLRRSDADVLKLARDVPITRA
jgi:peptidoglycan/LPS O-acetylase OafA/YrhL